MKDIAFLTALLCPFTFASFDFAVTDSAVPSSEHVTYACRFENEWSRSNHPNNYPSSAHWSPPVLVAHSLDYTMWREGGMATEGVELVAETGNTRDIMNEITTSTSTGDVVTGRVTFNSNTQMQNFDPIEMTSENHILSTITMVAPSPDWFTGFYDFDAINPLTQTWYRQFNIETFPFDAGTEEGNTYRLGNPPTNPQEPILRLDVDTVPSTGVFLNDSEDEVLPVAKWVCLLEQQDPVESPIPACFSERSTVEVKGKGKISMKELKIGDEVKIGESSFDRVYSFGHKSTHGTFSYLQIKTNGKDSPMEISQDHMLFVVDQTTTKQIKRAVPASHVKVGDWLETDSGSPVLVERVTPVFREGAYAPFTMTGKVAVNGIVSSNYISFFQETDAVVIGDIKLPLTMHFVAHMFTSPLRVLTVMGVEMEETYTKDGLSNLIALPHAVAKKLVDLHGGMFGILMLLATFAVMPFYAIELALSSNTLLCLLFFAAAAACSAIGNKKRSKSLARSV